MTLPASDRKTVKPEAAVHTLIRGRDAAPSQLSAVPLPAPLAADPETLMSTTASPPRRSAPLGASPYSRFSPAAMTHSRWQGVTAAISAVVLSSTLILGLTLGISAPATSPVAPVVAAGTAPATPQIDVGRLDGPRDGGRGNREGRNR